MSINPHIDKMETLQLWKAHHLQYVLRQTGPDFHSIPVVAVHPGPEIRDHVVAVALADAGIAEPEEAPSAQAVVVYGVAATLHVHHGVPWPDALAAGERAFHGWARHTAPVAGKPKRQKLFGLGGDDGPAPDLDIQPLDFLPRG